MPNEYILPPNMPPGYAQSGTSVTGQTLATAATDAWSTKVTGDVNDRFVIDADGTLHWGPGNAALDTKIDRAAAGALRLRSEADGSGNLTMWNAGAHLTLMNVDGSTTVGTIERNGSTGGLALKCHSGAPLHFSLGASGTHYVFDAAKDVVLGGSGAALATGATAGFTFLPSCAGTPMGTPTSRTGAVPFIFDSTNKKLYAYTGGAWVATAAFT